MGGHCCMPSCGILHLIVKHNEAVTYRLMAALWFDELVASCAAQETR